MNYPRREANPQQRFKNALFLSWNYGDAWTVRRSPASQRALVVTRARTGIPTSREASTSDGREILVDM